MPATLDRQMGGKIQMFTTSCWIFEIILPSSHQYLTNILTVVMTSITTNQTSYRKFYFKEFVQNSIGFNMGIIFLTSDLMEAARGQKHPSDAKNGNLQKFMIFEAIELTVVPSAQEPTKRGCSQYVLMRSEYSVAGYVYMSAVIVHLFLCYKRSIALGN